MRVFIFGMLLFMGMILLSFSQSTKQDGFISQYEMDDSLKVRAFTVLENQCNECHLEKKPFYVFTPDNMNAFASLIHVQVFIKQKMPKGRKNELTTEESVVIKKWLDTVLEKD